MVIFLLTSSQFVFFFCMPRLTLNPSSSSIIISIVSITRIRLRLFRYCTAQLTPISLHYNLIRCRAAFAKPRRYPRLLSARAAIKTVLLPLILSVLLLVVVIIIIVVIAVIVIMVVIFLLTSIPFVFFFFCMPRCCA